MAKRFGHNPNVIGWQIDNEYAEKSLRSRTPRRSSSSGCKAALRDARQSERALDHRLLERDLHRLVPDSDPDAVRQSRPAADLEAIRQRHLAQLPEESARRHSRQFRSAPVHHHQHDGLVRRLTITTPSSKDLDLAAWDDYVGQGHLDPAKNGVAHDLTRGFKRKNFWVMETQPGFVNWAPDQQRPRQGRSPRHGMARHRPRRRRRRATGNGAAPSTARRNTTARCVGADGTPVPLYAEVAADRPRIRQSRPCAGGNIAQIRSRDSPFLRQPLGHRLAAPQQELRSRSTNSSATTRRCGPSASPSTSSSRYAPLSQYKLVVAPGLNVLSDAAAKNLIEYVRQGGHLVLGQRSGMKNDDNGLQPQRQPGPLADLLGGRVEQYYALTRSGSGRREIRLRTKASCGPNCSAPMTRHRSPRALRQEQWLARRQARSHHPQSRQGPHHLHRRLAR